MSQSSNRVLALAQTGELPPLRPGDEVPTTAELEVLDDAIAEIDLQLAGACQHSMSLRDRREELLSGRTNLRRHRERAGLFESGAPVNFYGLDYVGKVAQYFDPDPNLMRGDGLRQVWPPGALENIRRTKFRR